MRTRLIATAAAAAFGAAILAAGVQVTSAVAEGGGFNFGNQNGNQANGARGNRNRGVNRRGGNGARARGNRGGRARANRNGGGRANRGGRNRARANRGGGARARGGNNRRWANRGGGNGRAFRRGNRRWANRGGNGGWRYRGAFRNHVAPYAYNNYPRRWRNRAPGYRKRYVYLGRGICFDRYRGVRVYCRYRNRYRPYRGLVILGAVLHGLSHRTYHRY